jgi:hypothetical protein
VKPDDPEFEVGDEEAEVNVKVTSLLPANNPLTEAAVAFIRQGPSLVAVITPVDEFTVQPAVPAEATL